MKLPRWLCGCMLSVSALVGVGAAGWWWITWPDRIAQEFIEYCEAAKWDKANEILAPESWDSLAHNFEFQDERASDEVERSPRSLLEMVIGKAGYVGPGGFWFSVERGHVISIGHL